MNLGKGKGREKYNCRCSEARFFFLKVLECELVDKVIA